ncbi:FAD dependent oxidoreductase [Xylogone sp. PMI_703]|nr:FAD dependent oxidoreductase [Xylogone sp. PMI_703]
MSLDIRTVAVIGAGVSGVASAAHLKKAGLDVTVFERTGKTGGVWVFDSRRPPEPAYPSIAPSVAETAFFKHNEVEDSDSKSVDSGVGINREEQDDPAILHAPPGPCYEGLHNNVPTGLMELTLNSWKPGTEQISRHNVLAEYIQDTSSKAGVDDITLFNTRVDLVEKTGNKWHVRSSTLENGRIATTKDWEFDAVVVASGHYHAPYVPDIPGLADWKQAWPDRIQHSKRYRSPKVYKDKTVLLIGGSTSSSDIAKELEGISKKTYQSTRNGLFDHPASMLPSNAVRIGEIASFNSNDTKSINSTVPIPGSIILSNGTAITDIDNIIVCTGYHMSYPFLQPLSSYHDDSLPNNTTDPNILVTDGQQTHNLHKDIFYIPDPTLAFIGVPYHIATFSFFDFQAIYLATIFSGKAPLPTEQEMRAEYEARVKEKGSGRKFHSLMGKDAEYVNDIFGTINPWIVKAGGEPLKGHSEKWKVQYEELKKKMMARKAIIPTEIKELNTLGVDRKVPYVAGIEAVVDEVKG